MYLCNIKKSLTRAVSHLAGYSIINFEFASFMYSVSTNFRLELIEPSAREINVGSYFLALTLFRVSLILRHVLSSLVPSLFSSLDQSPKNKYISSRRPYKLQAKSSGHAVHKEP